MVSGNTRNRKQNKGGGKVVSGAFDKSLAISKVDVPVSGPGVYAFPEEATSVDRVWVEWHPSAAVEGKRRRCFLSKVGVSDPSEILTDSGRQLPRKGLSCKVTSRCVVVFGAGKLKIWITAERSDSSASVTQRELPSELLKLVAPDMASSPPRQGAPVAARPAHR